jgi:hypothetical protein
MATVILIYGGYDFYKKAWAGLRSAAFSMETLIIIGALSAYFFSTYNLFTGSIHLYYDTASMLITLVLLGKTLEHRAKGKVLEDLENFPRQRKSFRRFGKFLCVDAHQGQNMQQRFSRGPLCGHRTAGSRRHLSSR